MDTFESGRHPVDIGHLVMGVAFLGLVGVWALFQGDVVEGGQVRWLLPVPWVLAGLAGLLATTVGSRRRSAPADPAPPEGDLAEEEYPEPAETDTTGAVDPGRPPHAGL